MVFADDERKANPTGFKFLQMAHAWKESVAKGTNPTSVVVPTTPAHVEENTSTNDDSDDDESNKSD